MDINHIIKVALMYLTMILNVIVCIFIFRKKVQREKVSCKKYRDRECVLSNSFTR